MSWPSLLIPAYGFAPASLVAPLGAVSLLSNVIIAPTLLNEPVVFADILGIILAVAGAVAVVICAQSASDPPLDARALWIALERPTFLVFATVMLTLGVLLMWLCRSTLGARTVLVHVGVCSVFGGFTVLATKGVSSLLVQSAAKIDYLGLLSEPLFYLLLLVLFSTAILQLAYLNQALQRFDSRHVIPTQFVLFTLSTIVGSAFLYRDFKNKGWEQIVGFAAGCLCTFLGVFVLTCDWEEPIAGHVAPSAEDMPEIIVDVPDVARPPGSFAVPVHVSPVPPKAPRRRAYSTMSLPDPPPRQTLANMAAALVEQSQNYLRRPTGLEHPRQLVARRRRHRNPFSPADSTATYSGSAGSLTDMGLERLRHAQAQTAFLGISPGRNLLLMPTHGSPRLLPAESPRDDAAPHEPSL